MAEFIRSFDDIIGHQTIINFIKSKIAKNTLPNAIIFNGNAGLGKTSIAKVIAIELNGSSDYLYKSVIDENNSVDCIKLFNMSSVGDDTENVVSELQNVALSSTGKKVVILDEVHGMTKKAQDAILVNLEYLPDNLYVIMCTTELSLLRESLISRCVVFNLNNLSYNEIKQVIKRKIDAMSLKFDIALNIVVNLIATWSNNQPRKAINLLESFEQNSLVTQNELAAFIPTNNIPIVISLVNYLYGSLTLGIEFVDTLSITNDFLQTMIEVLKVGLGHRSSIVSKNDSFTISKLFKTNNINNFLMFTISVNSVERISKRVFTAKFIEHHVSIYKPIENNLTLTPNSDVQSSVSQDLKTIEDYSLSDDKNDNSLSGVADNRVSMDILWGLGQEVT